MSMVHQINNISAYVLELEEENKILKAELELLTSNPVIGDRENLKDYLIELIAPDIKKLYPHKDTITDRLGEIYRTYKRLFPDDCEKEG